ncbi:hypothetical protein BD769DRAFT_1676228 [Suillus cothurnatus]|nr:hypothetical protein BD769DRAFT_1676228 [Suillus cothurnatus]
MQWRDAASSAIHDELYAKFAIRWSELLCLPYWDPTHFTVLDVMHNLFLGNIAHHVWNILGIDADAHPPGKEHIKPHTMEEQQEQLDTAISAVKKGPKTSLMHLRQGYIVSLATANNVAPVVTITKDLRYRDRANNSKSLYVDALIKLYKINPGAEICCPKVFPSPTIDLSSAWGKKAKLVILHNGILQEVWSDMSKTRIPSWLNRAPANFGHASHSKIKADQWQTVCLVNLVITLCRLWGTPKADENEKAMLQNFIALIIAVHWATTHSTSETHIQLVEQNYTYYLKTTIQLFGPGAVKTNNNHATQHLAE